MKILVLADIDEFHWNGGTGEADVLVSCGDTHDDVIVEAARAFNCRKVFAVKGNHDGGGPFHPPVIDLHRRIEEFEGVRFGGLNGSWAYKPRGHFLYDQPQVEEFLRDFPPVDVLISHNSPRGIHDRDDLIHIGFDGLRGYLERAKPRLLIHGHQHIDRETTVGPTRVLSVYGHRVVEFVADGPTNSA